MPSRRGKRWSIGPKASRFRDAAGLATPRDLQNLSPLFSNGFTMRDEARNTASHQTTWGQDARLRQKPVTFVSAGVTEPLRDLKPTDEQDVIMGEETASKHDVDPGEAPVNDETTDVCLDSISVAEATVQIETLPEIPTSLPQDEVPGNEMVMFDLVDKSSTNPEHSPLESAPVFFLDLDGDNKNLRQDRPPVDIPLRLSSPARSDSSEEVILYTGRGRSGRPQVTQQQTSQADPLAKAASLFFGKTRERTLPISPSLLPDESNLRVKTPRRQHPSSRHRTTQNNPAPEDDEENAILADYIANMAAQSEDDMLPQPFSTFNTRRDLGGEHTAVDFGDEDSEEASSSDDEDDQVDAGDISDDDMAADLDDETLARLLAKQEELGMGANELLLYSDSYAQLRAGSRRTGNQSSRLPRLGTASVADAFNDLNLTDRNPPTGTTRRSKQPPNFNVSDSEIEMALKSAWQKDRDRKKKRKLEREALRSKGLLGKNVNPDDLRVKYQSHMTLDDIQTEIVSFLLDTTETIQFPPMDKQARKSLHELANKFKIKSQSTGKGDQRRPVLYRTKHTARYASSSVAEVTNHVERASATIKRKYFHRLDNKGGPALPRSSNAKRSGHNAVTYREGEIVGASAPQLGQANKGHAMLEKMGWSKGMALGTLENKGILEPVAQVVKRSKAGLG